MSYLFNIFPKYIKYFFSILICLLSFIYCIQAHAEINKKSWSDQEIINLGYIPDEIVIKFNNNKINLRKDEKKLNNFIENNSNKIGNSVINKLQKIKNKSQNFNSLSANEIDSLKKNYLQKKETLAFANMAVIKLSVDDAVQETINELKGDPNIDTITPNYVFKFESEPNDTYYDDQWGLQKIQIEDAWDEMLISPDNVIVAVLDTGVYHNHPDLGANLWDAPNNQCIMGFDDSVPPNPIYETCTNHGWDFVNEDNSPFDDKGHGTHVSGIIGAFTNNNLGVAGTAKNVKLMEVKIGNSYGVMTDIIEGINFAKNNGAQIINASFGGTLNETAKAEMENSFNDFLGDNHLLIAAAGNYASDNGSYSIYPANYTFNELISVAATDDEDSLVYIETGNGSNWGDEEVDIAAPGYEIYSTDLTRDMPLPSTPNPDPKRLEFGEEFNNGIGDLSKIYYQQNPQESNYWGQDSFTGGNSFLSVDTNVTSIEEGYPYRQYSHDMNEYIITPTYDFSGSIAETAMLRFDVWCDTEPQYEKENVPDYLEVDFYDSNISDWQVLDTIYEEKLEEEMGDEQINHGNIYYQLINDYAGVSYDNKEIIVPSDYMNNNNQAKFRIRWVTDSTNLDENENTKSYAGCMLDNMSVIHVTANTYGDEGWGTSYSAPFVTGVAAMIMGAYPDIETADVKQIIMYSGDDISSLNPTKPTASNKRLNAYRALVMAEQVNNNQEIILYPTIHSKTTGGYWSVASTWVENRVPNSNDVVEINGAVYLNTNATIAGLLVKTGVTFKNSYPNRTLTVNGDFVNNGSVSNYSDSYPLTLVVTGNAENNGTLSNNTLTLTGNLNNTGTLAKYINIQGNLTHSGTQNSGNIYFNGISPQNISASNPLYYISLANDVTSSGNLTITNQLTVASGKTLTIGYGNTLSVAGDINNLGTVSGGDVLLNGSEQNFSGGGVWNVDSLTFGGTGGKNVNQNKTINGDVEVISGVTLRNNIYGTYTLTVNGDFVNNGAVTNYGTTYKFNLAVGGNMENTGTLSNQSVTLSGSMDNSGTLGTAVSLQGNLTHSGTQSSGSIYFNGISPQNISASNPLYYISLANDVTSSGNLTITNQLTVASGKTLTIGDGNTLYLQGTVNNLGIVDGGDVVLSGSSQDFSGNGLWDVDSVLFGGSGVKQVYMNKTITGNVEVASGVILTNNIYGTYTLTVNGDFVNNGAVTNYGTTYKFNLMLYQDLDNNGTMSNNTIYAVWDAVQGVNSYDFQVTDTSYNWLTPVSTGANTYSSIKNYVNEGRKWRWRSVTGGTPSDWSADKNIN